MKYYNDSTNASIKGQRHLENIIYNPLKSEGDLNRYIKERRLEFYEEWFQYLDKFYD